MPFPGIVPEQIGLVLFHNIQYKLIFLPILCVLALFFGSTLANAAPTEPPADASPSDTEAMEDIPQYQGVDQQAVPQSGGNSSDENDEEALEAEPTEQVEKPEPEDSIDEDGDSDSVEPPEATENEPAPLSEVLPEPQSRKTKVASPKTTVEHGCNIPAGTYKGKVTGTKRLGGKDRYLTNVAIAKAVSASGQDGKAVFVANGVDYADGLALGALAAKTGWPLFLVGKNSISRDVAAQIKAVKPSRIIIAGGNGAVSSKVQRELTNMGASNVKVSRFAGKDRYETAAKIAECFPKGSQAFVVTGANFADAVVAGPAAASKNGAVVLTRTGAADPYAKKAISTLKPERINIIGGSWSNGVQNAFKSAAGGKASVKVYKGSDRYQTSAIVADNFFGNSKNAVYSNGTTFPDSLSGISVAKTINAPIVLTRSNCRPANIAATTNKRTGTKVLLGGAGVVTNNSYTSTCVAAKPKPAPTKTPFTVAKSLVGSKASAGAAATNPQHGFDCAGFTQYVYAQVGKKIPRSSYSQWSAGKKVSNPQAGDIVIMSGGGHVGIYAGNGMIIDSPGYVGTTVKYRSIWGPVNGYVRF